MIDWEKVVAWFYNKIDGTEDNDDEIDERLITCEQEKLKQLRRR